MQEKLIIYLRHVEITGLYMLFFFLPFLKVPKNIGIALFIIGAIGWRIAARNIKIRKPDLFESLLLSILLIAMFSTIANWPFPKGINGLKDTLNIVLIGWFLYISRYSRKQLKTLLWVIVCGSFIGLLIGFSEWKSGISAYFDFRSMMVAETSIITGMVLAALLGVIFDSVSECKSVERILAIFFAILFLLCMFLMGNRSGLLGFGVFFSLLVLKFIANKKTLVVVGVLLISFLASSYIFTSGKSHNRVEHLLSTRLDINNLNTESMSRNDQFRFAYWRLAIAQATQGNDFLLGIGPRNFGSIDYHNFSFKTPLFEGERLVNPVHAHNMYLTKLVEEGVLGLCALLLFWCYVAWVLFKSRPKVSQVHWLWVACLGAIIIPFIAGVFYAPYRREVAWVSMMFIGLAANQLKLNKEMNVDATNV